MRDKLHERGLKLTSDRTKLPLVSEDPAKDEWLHQEVLDSGIVTIAQRMVKGNNLTPKKLMTFGYDVERFFPPLSDNRAEFRLVSEDGGVLTHHQRMLTPFIISNRSVFPTTYHKHSEDGINGAYTLIRSSSGNDEIAEANAE